LDISGLFDKGTPIFFDDCGSIHFISFLFFVLHVGAILQESEHVNDGSEVDIDFRFLLSDFLKSVHNLTQGIDVLGWFIDFESNLLHVIIECLKHSVSSDVEIVGVSILPGSDFGFQAQFDVTGLKRKSTNLFNSWDCSNFVLEFGELVEFFFEILKLWFSGIEFFEFLLLVLLPKPVKSIETNEESSNTVLCSLDRTSQKKNNLDNFFVLGNPVIEWLSKLLWLIFLIPVLNVLGRFQNVGSGSVNGRLNISKVWLECAVSFSSNSSIKMNINLEEWLQDLLWHVSSSANSFFHLIERIFGGVEKSLIHGPIVVFGQLLDFFS